MQDISQKIIDSAGKLFLQYGFKSITMDDIARDLSISKKTIYQVFREKNEIVCILAGQFLDEQKEKVEIIEKESKNVIERLYKGALLAREVFDRIHPHFLYELKKFYGEAWEIYLEYKKEVLFNSMIDNLKEGIKEGYFREDIDVEVMASLHLEEVQLVFDITVFPNQKFDFRKVQLQLFDHFVYGIVTEKGYSLYKSYKKNIVIQ